MVGKMLRPGSCVAVRVRTPVDCATNLRQLRRPGLGATLLAVASQIVDVFAAATF